eukprot:5366820-Amphidinium_carterae.1
MPCNNLLIWAHGVAVRFSHPMRTTRVQFLALEVVSLVLGALGLDCGLLRRQLPPPHKHETVRDDMRCKEDHNHRQHH